MDSTEKILSITGEPLLSAKQVAVMLDCAPDYVSKLCREGKLVCIRSESGWLIEKESVAVFDRMRAVSKLERARELSAERKVESARHNKQTKVFSANDSKKSTAEFLASHRAFAFAVSGLLGVLVFVGSFMLSHASIWKDDAGKSPLAAALGQIDSPFFGARPAQIAIPDFRSGSSTSNFFSNIFTSIFNSTSAPVATTPASPWQTTVQVVPTQVRASGTSTTIVQNSTYPIIERTVERVVTQNGLSQQTFDTAFSELTNALISKIYQLSSQQNNSFTTNYAPSQRIDNLQNVTINNSTVNGLSGLTDADIPDGITASNYLPLTGGTVGSLTIGTLDGPLQANAGVVSATSSVGTIYGGTGLTSYNTGDILYASAPNTLSTLAVGANGRVLKISGGVPTWGVDNSGGGGGGGSGAWATTTDSLAIYPSDISQVVLVGNDATTTLGNIFEVSGNALFRNGVTTYGVSTASSFTATSTTASIFPYASSTAISVSGTASTSNLIVSNNLTLAQSFTGFLKATAGVVSTALVDLAANVTGILPVSNGGTGVATIESNSVLLGNGTGAISTTTRGNLTATGITVGNGTNAVLGSGTTLTLDTSGNWGGTFDGQEGSYYLANSFSTTSASYFLSQNLGSAFSTTSADYWKTQNNFFSTTSSAYWLTTKTTTNLTEGSNLYYTDARVQTYLDSIGKGYFFSTTSTDYWKTQNDFFSTTSASYFLAQNTGAAFSTTSSNYWLTTKTTDNLTQGSTNKYYSDTLVNSYIHASTTIPKAYTANTFSAANTFNGTITFASLNGPLQANNGVLSATSSIGVLYGGTGLTASPSYGQVLLGNASGGYDLVATSSLGITGGGGGSISAIGPSGQTQTGATITFATSTSGSDFTITASGNTVTYNLPTASASNTGKLSTADWNIFNNKISSSSLSGSSVISYNSGTGVITTQGGTFGAGNYVFPGNITATGGQASFANASTTNLSANTAAFGGTGTTTISSTGALSTPSLTIGSLSGLLYGNSGAVAAAAVTSPLSFSAGTLSITQSGAGASGYLSATDWNIFNNKISSTSLSGGTGISYNSSSGVITNTGVTSLTGTANQITASASTGAVALSLPSLLLLSQASTTQFSSGVAYFGTTATSTFAGNGALTLGGTFTLSGSPNGPLQANAGVVSATTSIGVLYGGTGSTTLTGILKGNGTGQVQTAVGGADYEFPLTFSAPLTRSTNSISITQSGAGASGYLSATDWNIFNNKISSSSLSGASVISYNSLSGVITTQGGTFGAGDYVFQGNVVTPYASSTALTVSGTTFLNNLLATASSTIGGGTQATGLTVNGGATTTGSLIVQGAASSTFANGIDIAAGCFARNGICLPNTAITAIGPTGQTQTGSTITFATSTSGSDFTITASGNTVTYNLPTASAANTGKLSTADWNIFNNKISSSSLSGASVIAYDSSTGVITTNGGTFGGGNYTFPGNLTATGGLAMFANATTSLLSVSTKAYFGSTATSTFDSAGNLSVAGTLGVTGSTTLANASSTSFYNSGALTVDGNIKFSSFGSGCYLLTDGSGNVTCGSVSASGGDTNWSYFNGSGLRLATTSNQVLIGASATSSLAKLEVQNGNVYFQNSLGIGTSSPYLPLSVAGSGVVGGTLTSSALIATTTLSVGTTSTQSAVTVAGGNITHTASGNPTLATTVSTTDFVYSTYVVGNYAYVAENANGLRILDISNPKSPVTVGSYTGISSAFSVVVAGKYAYVGDSVTGLNIIDVSNPKNPTLVGVYGSSGRSFTLAVSGKYVYAPDILTGVVNIIDVGDPTNPVLAGTYTTNGATGNPYAVAVSGKYLYIGDQGTQRIYIVDVSNPAAPTLMSSYSTNVVTPTGIVVSGQYAYITDNSKGFYTLDISNPASITAVATYSNTSNYGGLSVAGQYAYISDRTNGALVVLDVSASTTPRLIGSYSVGSTPRALFVSGKYAYLSGYDLGLKVVDINGLETPAANIGSLAAGTANIADSLNVGGDIYAGGGLDVGISGIYSRGTIAAYVASSTQTNPVVASFMGGNVGVGTTSPFTKLSVAGSAFFTGNVTATNITATGTLAVFGNTTLANATSTSLFGNILTSNIAAFGSSASTTISSTGALSTPALTIGSLSGILYGNSGVVAAAAVTSPLSFSAGTLSITQSGAGASGYLSSVDWNIFNNKISSTSLSGSSVISYNSGTGVITTQGGTFGAGNYVFPGNITATGGQASFANASTTNLSANTTAFGGTGTTSISSTGALSTPSATIGSLTGLLKGSSGVVSAAVAGTDYLVNAIIGVGPAGQTQTGPTITYASSTAGTDFTITASGNTITFNLPTASNSNRGLLSSADWTTFNSKAGLGANTFTGLQQFNAGASTTQLSVFDRAYFGATATSTFTSTGALGIASSTPWGLLSINPNGISGPSFVIGSSTLTSFIVTNGGNVGIGTTSPYSIFSVSQTASVAQFSLAYDTADRTDFRTDATGNLWVVPTGSSGGNVYMTNNNLWVCTGGSITSNACPTGTPTGQGNIIAQNKIGIGTSTPNSLLTIAGTRPSIDLSDTTAGTNLKHWLFTSAGGTLYIGTSTDAYATSTIAALTINSNGFVGVGTTTPTQGLSVAQKLFVGNGAPTTAGTATSTFQGDVLITGKLDVSTIDPVYTIDGTKYATYGLAGVSVKEEMSTTVTLTTKNKKTGKYEYVIDFSKAPKGSDTWLFYQVTTFGEGWKDLVANVTPGFDGTVFYTKDPATNTLHIVSDTAGEVSVRLVATRFDTAQWPNLRPDQDGGFGGFQLQSK